MERATGYSLWLMPSGDAFDALSQTIRELSKTHGTVVFEPHATLIGGLQEKESSIIARTKKLAEVLQPFAIELGAVECGTEYFRCLYYTIAQNSELRNAYARACDIFRVTQQQYMPHLSLMYGDISRAVREKTASKMKPPVHSFAIKCIDLVLTHGTVSEWRKVKQFAL